MTNLKLTHPDSKQTVEVADEKRAEAYLSQGWVEKTAKAESDDKPDPK